MAKSPLGRMLEKVSATFCLLVSVTVFAVLVLPAITVPKLKLLAERVAGAAPVPESEAVCGLVVAPSTTLRVPDADPTAVGVNATRMVQLARPANDPPLDGQVPPVR